MKCQKANKETNKSPPHPPKQSLTGTISHPIDDVFRVSKRVIQNDQQREEVRPSHRGKLDTKNPQVAEPLGHPIALLLLYAWLSNVCIVQTNCKIVTPEEAGGHSHMVLKMTCVQARAQSKDRCQVGACIRFYTPIARVFVSPACSYSLSTFIFFMAPSMFILQSNSSPPRPTSQTHQG